MNHHLVLLVLVQVLFMIGNMMFVALAPVLGKELAGSMSLATLPLAISILTMLICSFPLSMAMGQFGRKPVFAFGIVANLAAGVIFFTAVKLQLFSLFLLGSVVFGLSMASANFYRFAAMELVEKHRQALAISAVMAAGVVAAVVGPNLGAVTQHLFFEQAFASSVLLYIPISIIAMALLLFIQWPQLQASSTKVDLPLDLKGEIWQPMFTAAVAYGVMVLIMSATPLHMSHHHYDFSDTAWVIQWHLIGMFAPSFFVSGLVKRLGLKGLLLLGALVLVASLLVNLIAQSRTLLTLGLLLLGIGWNFLFLGASQWLMKLSEHKNGAKVQGVNEVLVFGFAAIATFSSGWLLAEFGWITLNLASLPLLALLLVVLLKSHGLKPSLTAVVSD
ncbi:MFS transporter [Motilimonas cestriensis]|uniref:MFS transporter n=1 Tax=Motilimonas cestriensis TaxID=2742685 RepID=A0ABS8WAA8_9GAMM|nr:MFS transporter [Motilimonas cestriensis]